MSDFVNIFFIKNGQALWDSSAFLNERQLSFVGLVFFPEQKRSAKIGTPHPRGDFHTRDPWLWAKLGCSFLGSGQQECCSPMDAPLSLLNVSLAATPGEKIHGGRICISDSEGLVCKRKRSLSSPKHIWVCFSMRLNFYYKNWRFTGKTGDLICPL